MKTQKFVTLLTCGLAIVTFSTVARGANDKIPAQHRVQTLRGKSVDARRHVPGTLAKSLNRLRKATFKDAKGKPLTADIPVAAIGGFAVDKDLRVVLRVIEGNGSLLVAQPLWALTFAENATNHRAAVAGLNQAHQKAVQLEKALDGSHDTKAQREAHTAERVASRAVDQVAKAPLERASIVLGGGTSKKFKPTKKRILEQLDWLQLRDHAPEKVRDFFTEMGLSLDSIIADPSRAAEPINYQMSVPSKKLIPRRYINP